MAKSEAAAPEDRKSTRLNSSHDQISYAVFCLKKKNGRGGLYFTGVCGGGVLVAWVGGGGVCGCDVAAGRGGLYSTGRVLSFVFFFFKRSGAPGVLPFFPPRGSSD